MKLLTTELKQRIPPLYSQEQTEDPLVVCKFFTPDSGWTWYVIEGSPTCQAHGFYDCDDPACGKPATWNAYTFFGLVDGFEQELGYFALKEMESARGPLGLPIERDLHWKPKPLSQVNKG